MLNNHAVCIGFGVVGKSTSLALGIKSHIDIDNIYYNENEVVRNDEEMYWTNKYYILCLPTPTRKDGTQDLSALSVWVEKITAKNNNAVIIIRSTVLPGYTKTLIEKLTIKAVFIPEFLNENTAEYDAKNPDLFVLGCNDIWLKQEIRMLFKPIIDNAKHIIECDTTTAEAIKYTLNSFFTLKVIFANQLWDMALKAGANYEQLEKSLESHKWGSKNGWNVWHGGNRGVGGKCLPKDVEAFTKKFKLELLGKALELNKSLQK